MVKITRIEFVKKSIKEYPTFLGFASIVFDDSLGVDGIGVHRSSSGKVNLVFPVSARGKSVVYPVDEDSRKQLTKLVEEAWNEHDVFRKTNKQGKE